MKWILRERLRGVRAVPHVKKKLFWSCCRIGSVCRIISTFSRAVLEPRLAQEIVQVYAAPTFGWRGLFAVHPWIIFKRSGETSYTRHDVIGWRGTGVVRHDYALPDGLWFGAQPGLLADHRGEGVDALIGLIEAAIASYPYPDTYKAYPGPNSNTFLAHIGRKIPAFRLDLPANAIGKDYWPISRPVGISASGNGMQASILGLFGFNIGLEEGIEFNLLGLNFGLI